MAIMKILRLQEKLFFCISIAYFWDKQNEIETLKGKIAGKLRFSGISELKEKYEEISNKLMMLAKYNYSEILRYKDEMAQ